MLGNLVAATGFPHCIASINVKSSPCGLSVGFKNTSNEFFDGGTGPSATTLSPRSAYRYAHGPEPGIGGELVLVDAVDDDVDSA
ncbi:hypothetical protein C4D60_Mb04t08240 [Musa balbisiana]|uniref:Uncharacterized protein n=1 Tax=Musa balbisiana TaxID=52838 RepID=A0A4S8KAG1_MUSBA|nr:hypothetical protein C4D60_Mb04t08240 [Musa balbisiana]